MIPLQNHSWFSFLQGTMSPEAIARQAKAYGLSAAAITDTNSMAGVVPFIKACREEGVKPIPGAVIDCPAGGTDYITLLARNRDGFSELCRVITARKLKEGLRLQELIAACSANLYVLTPSTALLEGLPPRHNVVVQLLPAREERFANRARYEFCQKHGYRFAAVNPVFFATPADHYLHRVVAAIKHRTTLDNLQPGEMVPEYYYFKDPAVIAAEWHALPEALATTDSIAADCNVDLPLGTYHFPAYPVPEGESSYSMLWQLATEGLHRRYSRITKKITDRLQYELDTINDMHFTDYFLVVWDIVREAKRRGMMMIGRGSAANSLVSYLLEFTEVDPIRYNLYFERFLNRSRTSPPDVDLDFSWKERDELVKYVFERYGYERVAMICTTVTFRARSAFRETAKVYGFSDREISKFSKFIPWTNAVNLPNITAMFPEAKKLPFHLEPWKSITETAARLAGCPRHLSIHPSGIVIAPGHITNHTALDYAKNKGLGLIVTQPDMYSIEDLGLIKIDLLSQRSLGVVRDTMAHITARLPNAG